MDDRHSLSEPRRIDDVNGMPTWEVDVYRDGVEEPVVTLKINNATLPPRYRKKKLVWKLPSEGTPSFGSEDKRRIWDMFKKEKKSRRKSSKKITILKKPQGRNNGHEGNPPKPPEPKERVPSSATAEGGGVETENGVLDPTGLEKNIDATRNGSRSSLDTVIVAPPGLGNPPAAATTSNAPFENGHYAQDTKPPPDGNSLSSERQKQNTVPLVTAAPPPPPPGLGSPPITTETATTTQQQQYAPPGFSHQKLAFSIEQPSSHVAVELAKKVVDTYYALLSKGDVLLQQYFHDGIQKSLSINSAHHFCSSRQEVLLQIQSLQGSTWDVRGVVAQDSFQETVVLLVTGMVICGDAQEPMSYCHSLTLVPINSNHTEYQIHNDALAFMSHS